MRILHTSDWHIGRTFHGHHTLDALRGVLGALVDQVREHHVDVVVVAGDVFDSAAPAADCFDVLTDSLIAIRDAGAAVVVTSGNHDSAARLGFLSGLLRDGIHVITRATSVGAPVTIDDEHGPVHFYPLPYLEPALVRHLWPDDLVRTQADTMTAAMARVRTDHDVRGGRWVTMAHCFAAGVEATPGVEREIRQGTLDVVPVSVFDGPDYVALGHIHGRQVLSERVRYAGAPLHYSFGEAAKPRGSWLVDLDADGFAGATWLDLPIPRTLVTLRGAFDDIMAEPEYAAHADDWVCVEYTDPTPQRDAMRTLQSRFPLCAVVAHLPEGVPAAAVATYASRVRKATSDEDLIHEFLSHVRAGEGASDAERELIRAVLDESVRVEALR